MKQECVSIYDIQNKKGIVIKSQVVLEIEKLGFEITPDYVVNDRKSNLNDSDRGLIYFEKINDDKIYLSFCYEKCNKKRFNDELDSYIRKYHYEKFNNFIGEEIHEFIDDTCMYVMMYYEGYMLVFKKNGLKFTDDYFELYATAYSLYKLKGLEYNNSELEAQSGCIRNNGLNVYKYFGHLNIVRKDPVKTVMELKNQQLKDLLDKGINPDVELILPNKTYFGRNIPAEQLEENTVTNVSERTEITNNKEQLLQRIENISKELEELKKIVENI